MCWARYDGYELDGDAELRRVRAGSRGVWDLPDEYNPAVDFLRKHEDTSRTALRYETLDDGLERGDIGELAVKPGDRRVFFDEHHNLPEKTANKRTEIVPASGASGESEEQRPSGRWFLTDDLVERDDDGYVWFHSRADDVILTSGYRVGPMEVEDAILTHEAVEQAGVVGVPDETRGEAIKAFVKPATDGYDPDRLREEIRELVRDRLAEYPQHIAFVETLPTTTTGKIRRRSLREREGLEE